MLKWALKRHGFVSSIGSPALAKVFKESGTLIVSGA